VGRPRGPLIPPLVPGSCQLWWASAAADRVSLLDLLDRDERDRHDRFVRRADRALFAVSHALARIVAGHHAGVALGALADAGASRAGSKPRLAGRASTLQFSISHSGSHAVLAISRDVPLGVDIERVAADGPEASMLNAVLSPGERGAFAPTPAARRAWAFTRYWSRKEALLKATGDGLGIPPDRIAVSGPAEPPALVEWRHPDRPAGALHLYDLEPAGGYCAALATLGTPVRRSDHDGDALLWASG
jgi:4'-phosphopantetheinyl transferase